MQFMGTHFPFHFQKPSLKKMTPFHKEKGALRSYAPTQIYLFLFCNDCYSTILEASCLTGKLQ